MRGNVMFLNLFMIMSFSTILFCLNSNVAFADDFPQIASFADNNTCSIKVGSDVIDNFDCYGSRKPLLISYSYLYDSDVEFFVYIEQPLGNACDGGPLHVIINDNEAGYKPIGKIDFCGGKYPTISSGPSSFTIRIPQVDSAKDNKMGDVDIWSYRDKHLLKIN